MPGIRSERLSLRSPGPEDLAKAYRWGRDEELVRLYGGPPGDLVHQNGGYVLAMDRVGTGRNSDRLIGFIGLTGDTWAMRSAELRILIGNRSHWGKGYGREAITRFLAHVFAATDLDFIYLRVFHRNMRAVRCYENCGFRRAGRLAVRADSRYTDPPPADDLLLMTLARPVRGAGRPGVAPGVTAGLAPATATCSFLDTPRRHGID
jgi:RimJ/RimL family protein N-acetyltransferase